MADFLSFDGAERIGYVSLSQLSLWSLREVWKIVISNYKGACPVMGYVH